MLDTNHVIAAALFLLHSTILLKQMIINNGWKCLKSVSDNVTSMQTHQYRHSNIQSTNAAKSHALQNQPARPPARPPPGIGSARLPARHWLHIWVCLHWFVLGGYSLITNPHSQDTKVNKNASGSGPGSTSHWSPISSNTKRSVQ